MKLKKTNLLTWVLGLSLVPLVEGCVTREVVYQPAPPPNAVVAGVPAAPAPEEQVIPAAPGPTDVWVWLPGEWVWHGGWVWRPGRWAARPYAGAIWVNGCWGWRGHHRVWIVAHWR